MRLRLACALFLSLLPLTAHAATPPAWTIRQADSRITFRATQMGKDFEGAIGRYTHDIRFDPAHPETASAKITVDVSSLLTGDKDRDSALPAKEWFDSKSFPSAVFVSDLFKSVGERDGLPAFEASGTLTIKGVSLPVVLPFTLALKPMDEVEKGLKSAHVRGTLTIDRTAFNLGGGEWADPSVIGHNVTVAIDLTAFAKY